jgi:hypothetical protein
VETDAGRVHGEDLVGGGFEAFEVVAVTDVDSAGAVGDGGIEDKGTGAGTEERADEFEDEAGFDVEGAGVVVDAVAGEVEGARREGEGGGEGVEDAGGAAGDEAGAGFEGEDSGVEVFEGQVREGGAEGRREMKEGGVLAPLEREGSGGGVAIGGARGGTADIGDFDGGFGGWWGEDAVGGIAEGVGPDGVTGASGEKSGEEEGEEEGEPDVHA